MNSNPNVSQTPPAEDYQHEEENGGAGWAYTIGILGALFIVLVFIWGMRRYSQPADLGEARKQERAKALAELRAAEADALTSVGWADQSKGLVRLPIKDAKAMVLRNWQNPAAARSNLIERVEKATAVAPPKPSPFE